jgi:hypothetical protein
MGDQMKENKEIGLIPAANWTTKELEKLNKIRTKKQKKAPANFIKNILFVICNRTEN